VNNLNVSVLLPTTGRSFLLESIASVLASKGLQNLEVIVIDDSEKQDLKLDIEQVTIIRTGGKKGYLEALNLGAAKAKFDYVALMNDDDLISPDRLIKQAHILDSNDVGFCVAKLKKFKNDSRYELNNWLYLLNYSSYDSLCLILGPIGADATLMLNTRVVPTKCFEGIRMNQFGDWKFALQNYRKFGIKGLNEVAYHYRQHKNQLTAASVSSESIHDIYVEALKVINELNLPDISFRNFCQLTIPRHFGETANKKDITKILNWFESINWSELSPNPRFIQRIFLFKIIALALSMGISFRVCFIIGLRISRIVFKEMRIN